MTDKLAPDKRHEYLHQGRKVYEWDQTLQEVNIYVDTPPGVRACDMFCDIAKQHVKLGIKPNPPYMDVSGCTSTRLGSRPWLGGLGTAAGWAGHVQSIVHGVRCRRAHLNAPPVGALPPHRWTWRHPSKHQSAIGP